MRTTSPWATTARYVLPLLGALPAVACGSASQPSETGVETAEPTDPLSLKPTPKPPTTGPVIPPVCSFDPRTEHSVACATPQPYGNASSVTFSSCVDIEDTAWSRYARQLMEAGCSAPLYWEAWNPAAMSGFDAPLGPPYGKYDQANAYLMLCPVAQESAVNAMGCDVYAEGCVDGGTDGGQSLDPAHANTSTFCDTNVPAPATGWFWAVTWEDPMCQGGCMTTGCKP